MTSEQDMNAGKILSDKGMAVTTLTDAQIDAFRKIAQPAVRAHLEKDSGKALVGKLIEATAAAGKAN